MKEKNKKSLNKNSNKTIGNIDNISAKYFEKEYQKYDGYINNESFSYKINEIYATKEDLLKSYDDLQEYISHYKKEFEQYDVSYKEIEKEIKNKRGILSIKEIKKHKDNLTNELRKAKNHTEYFDKFQTYYKENKNIIEKSGGKLEGNFENLLNIRNRRKLEYLDYNEAKKNIESQVKEHINKKREKLTNITKELEKRKLSIFTFTRQKKLNSTNDFSMKNLEEIEKYIELIDKINEKLKVAKTNFLELTSKLKIDIEEIKLKELEIINTDIEDFIIKENLESELNQVE